MTVGELSRRTGVPIKALREYHDLGLIYSAGRSAANYRLFDDSALWCVEIIGTLRRLGLTVAEITELGALYQERPEEPIGPVLAERLRRVRARLDGRIAELTEVRRRIDEFERLHHAELAGRAGVGFGEAPARQPIHA